MALKLQFSAIKPWPVSQLGLTARRKVLDTLVPLKLHREEMERGRWRNGVRERKGEGNRDRDREHTGSLGGTVILRGRSSMKQGNSCLNLGQVILSFNKR